MQPRNVRFCHRTRPYRAWALALLLVAGCATDLRRDSERLALEGRYEEALQLVEGAARADPANLELTLQLARLREVAVSRLLTQGESARQVSLDAAEAIYQRVLRIEPGSARARGALERMATDRRHLALVNDANEQVRRGDHASAARTLQTVLAENPRQREALAARRRLEDASYKPPAGPKLGGGFAKPMTLQFRDANLRSVFEVLSRSTGFSFVLDKDVRPDLKTTISVKDAPLEEVMRLMLSTNQLDQKVVNESTIIIYPNTPQKQREYQELVVRAFYLANADAKQTLNLLRTVIKARDLFVDEKLNMVVMRDTPQVVRLAERLIAAQDLPDPEVMLELEVLEISRSKLIQIGVQWPSSVATSLVGGGAAGTGVPGVLTLPEWLSRNSGLVRLTVSDPLFLASLQQTAGSANLLANPRLRVRNREKANIHIGDRIPVFTTTAAVTGGFVSQSVNYLDVGLKLDVEPVVSLDDEVSIKLGLEVSRLGKEVPIPGTNAGVAYQIGTRKANTVLRLHDGETQVLAGLIQEEDRASASQVPGLGDLPVLGRLFSNPRDDTNRTELILLITPRIVRGLTRPEARFTEFPAGTETSGGGGAAPSFFVPGLAAPASSGVPRAPGTQ